MAPAADPHLARYLTPGRFSFTLEVARSSDLPFTEADTAIMHALGLHLEAAASRLAVGGRLPLSTARRECAPVQRFCWLVCDRTGRILRTNRDSSEMMRWCLPDGVDGTGLPPAWSRELDRRIAGLGPSPIWYNRGGRRVSVHVAPIRPTPDEYSVGFLEHPADADPAARLRTLGLTPREADVLHWVAEGKTNAEAGIILGISALTVKKHLENIFHRLGVENRTSAVVAAMEAMKLPPAG